MADFKKYGECPPSRDLLAFQLGEIEGESSVMIRRHLKACDFCVSEVDFYEHYPPAEEVSVAEPIPEPLLELAEALLKNKAHRSSSFDDLLK